MSIDGIGRPPIPPSGADPLGAALPTGTGESFHVERTSAPPPSSNLGPLSRLESGELSVDQYLDARVEEAAAPFAQRLSPEQFAFMKSSLRAELETDPVLVELVRRATGDSPGASEL